MPSVSRLRKMSPTGDPVPPETTNPPWTTEWPELDGAALPAVEATGGAPDAGAASSARATREVAKSAAAVTRAMRFTSKGPSRRRHGHLPRLYPCEAGALVVAMFRDAGGELPAAGRHFLPTRVPDGERNARGRENVEERGAHPRSAPAEAAHISVHVDEVDLDQPWIEQRGQAFAVRGRVVDAAEQHVLDDDARPARSGMVVKRGDQLAGWMRALDGHERGAPARIGVRQRHRETELVSLARVAPDGRHDAGAGDGDRAR